MQTVEETIEVALPLSVVYEQWNRFESFPLFMDDVVEVERIDGSRSRWVAEIGGIRREWYSLITEQVPNRSLAWRSEGGEEVGGRARFEPVGDFRTRLTVRLDYEPSGVLDQVAERLGIVSRRVKSDLARFKEFVESGGRADVRVPTPSSDREPPPAEPGNRADVL